MDKNIINDEFYLYDLRIEVISQMKNHVCSHKTGSFFEVQGENLIFNKHKSFSLYTLSAILPLIPAKQRESHKNDWMSTDNIIACPDPNCGGRFKITKLRKRKFKHSETTIVPLVKK